MGGNPVRNIQEAAREAIKRKGQRFCQNCRNFKPLEGGRVTGPRNWRCAGCVGRWIAGIKERSE